MTQFVLVTLGSSMPQTRTAFLAMIGQPSGQPGRNLKYEPALGQRIRDLARQGVFPEGWALELGVSLETLRLWSRRYPDFAEDLGMARLALIDFWTRQLIRNLNNPQARPGMYGLLLRRFPALYGANPVDLSDWLTALPEAPAPKDEETLARKVKAMSSEELQARLATLRDRRAAKAT